MEPLDESAWDAWSPSQLADRLRGVRAEWYIVGGWALDLWHGEQHRQHADLEFAVLPQDARRVASSLSELTFFSATDGKLTLSDPTKCLEDKVWQLWGADMETRRWRVDMMIERGTADLWRYKRDPSLVQLRKDAVRADENGIRYLAPSNVLLFKAKYCRPKDEDDFDAAIMKLDDYDRENLRSWLWEYHPGHKWLRQLEKA